MFRFVTEVEADEGVVIVLEGPLTCVQVPLPTEGVLPVIVTVLAQVDWSPPAFAVVGAHLESIGRRALAAVLGGTALLLGQRATTLALQVPFDGYSQNGFAAASDVTLAALAGLGGSALLGALLLLSVTEARMRIALQAAIYRTAFASWLSPINASLAFAIAFVLFWYVVLYLLHRRHIVFRV